MKVHVWSEKHPDYKRRMQVIRVAFIMRMKQREELSLVPKN